MSTKRSVILRGCPEISEVGKATEQINPGYLVKGVSYLAKQTGTTGSVPKAVALERDELGTGVDSTYQTSGDGTGNYYYASGDQVKVAVFDSGDEATMWIQSGENIVEDDLLESNGSGLLKEGSTKPIARAMETLGVISAATKTRVQFL